jgi:hypothetical protein
MSGTALSLDSRRARQSLQLQPTPQGWLSTWFDTPEWGEAKLLVEERF